MRSSATCPRRNGAWSSCRARSRRRPSRAAYAGTMPRGRFFDYREPPERPADPAVRRANLRRIARLFVPYKFRLAAVLALIVLAAGLGVIPAFLLRDLLNAT